MTTNKLHPILPATAACSPITSAILAKCSTAICNNQLQVPGAEPSDWFGCLRQLSGQAIFSVGF